MIDQLLAEFVDAWNAGQRPDVEEWVQRAPAADREAFCESLGTWLEFAPEPHYDQQTLAQIAAEPALQSALEASALLSEPAGQRVRSLRERAGLTINQLARSIGEALGLAPTTRIADYLHRLELAELPAEWTSQRLRDTLAAILRTDPMLLQPEAAGRSVGGSLFRAEEGSCAQQQSEFAALSQAAFLPAPDMSDEIDRLFFEGRDVNPPNAAE